MEEYKMVIISLLTSAITLFLKAWLDYLLEGTKDKRERKKLILQRKTDAAEKAMSWYQEAIDSYSFLQMACDELLLGYNLQAYAKYLYAVQKLQKLSNGTSNGLHPIYLYMDVSQIEQKHDAIASFYRINFFMNEMANLGLKRQELLENGCSLESEDIKELMNQGKPLLENISKELNTQINSMAEIQKALRKEFECYSIKV